MIYDILHNQNIVQFQATIATGLPSAPGGRAANPCGAARGMTQALPPPSRRVFSFVGQTLGRHMVRMSQLLESRITQANMLDAREKAKA